MPALACCGLWIGPPEQASAFEIPRMSKNFVIVCLLIVVACQEARLSMRKISAPITVQSKYCVGHREIVMSPAFYPTSGGVNCRECHESRIRHETHEAANKMEHAPVVTSSERFY